MVFFTQLVLLESQLPGSTAANTIAIQTNTLELKLPKPPKQRSKSECPEGVKLRFCQFGDQPSHISNCLMLATSRQNFCLVTLYLPWNIEILTILTKSSWWPTSPLWNTTVKSEVLVIQNSMVTFKSGLASWNFGKGGNAILKNEEIGNSFQQYCQVLQALLKCNSTGRKRPSLALLLKTPCNNMQ